MEKSKNCMRTRKKSVNSRKEKMGLGRWEIKEIKKKRKKRAKEGKR